jgi:hypothetical protein
MSKTVWSLERQLPKILVERQGQAGTIGAGPNYIVTFFSERLNRWTRKVLIRQESHQAGIG